ncbi:MAG: prepilin-type N-terminal cleavage/methylation domain-containing protein, partial [Aromatoleum sp.]|nr:prepilin-type N-terminal cleavage/methylation domain-containing protein [Aromatoleum sp.]
MIRHPRVVQHGFSLLEVLVAFVILSLVVTALFRVFGGSLANVSAAEDYSRAVIVA